MLAMNNEGFPLFKRTCSAQIVSMACFLWALKKCLLNGYLIVYTFSLPYYRSTFTRSPVSVSSLLETFSGPAQDCSVLVNRGGGFGRKFGSPSRQGTPGPPLDLNHPTTRGPQRPPGRWLLTSAVIQPGPKTQLDPVAQGLRRGRG